MRRLQSIQNVAAWLVTGTRRCDRISPFIRQLVGGVAHWLGRRSLAGGLSLIYA